jgi:hypothetical protein
VNEPINANGNGAALTVPANLPDDPEAFFSALTDHADRVSAATGASPESVVRFTLAALGLRLEAGQHRTIGVADDDARARNYQRLSVALENPASAGPHLRRAIASLGDRVATETWDDTGDQPLQVYADQALCHRLLMDALADDDEVEAERQRVAAAVPVVNVSLPIDALAPVAGQLAELVAGIQRLADHVDPTPAGGLVGTNYLAERLGVTVKWAGQLAENGTVPADCVAVRGGDGRQWRLYKDKVDAWLRVYRAENPGRRRRQK